MENHHLRRTDRALDARGMADVLQRGRFCTVSCIDAYGMPYGVPLSYVYTPREKERPSACEKQRYLCAFPGSEAARDEGGAMSGAGKSPSGEDVPASNADGSMPNADRSIPDAGQSMPSAHADAAADADAGEAAPGAGEPLPGEDGPAPAASEPAVLGTLYFHTTNEGGRKLDAFAHDARVCATIVEDVAARFRDESFTTEYSSVMAFGRIRRVNDAATARRALVDLCMKYLPEHRADIGSALQADFESTAVWALEIETLTGKKNR